MKLEDIINRLGSPVFDGVPLWVVVAIILVLIFVLLSRKRGR